MPRDPSGFPTYTDCEAKAKLDKLRGLVTTDLFESQYIDARSAARLLAAGVEAYKRCVASGAWAQHPRLGKLPEGAPRLGIVLSALFDLACNAEYVHGRMSNERWVYCNLPEAGLERAAFFSFLKQCPRCCLSEGLGARIEGAQHKPSSHHIGELTSTAMALILRLLSTSASPPITIGLVTKQSHDVDAVAFRSDLLVLLEVKASPLATFPVLARLPRPFTTDSESGPREVERHSLISIDYAMYPLSLYFPHAGIEIPLPEPAGASWPYPAIAAWLQDETAFLGFLSAWHEIFASYSIPKRQRTGRDVALAYLANGWGDDIDSNKTKPGLGRTDDIKKGTYQLLKYGAYYRAGCPSLNIRGALVSNLDPLFMFDEYMAKLIDVRWAKSDRFRPDLSDPKQLRIADRDLLYLYDALVVLNRPVVNDPILLDCFDLRRAETSLHEGALDALLAEWSAP